MSEIVLPPGRSALASGRAAPAAAGGGGRPLRRGVWPVAAVGVCILILWYAMSLRGNWPEAQARLGASAGFLDTARAAMGQDNPWVPPPHQVAQSLFDYLKSPSDPTSMWMHIGTTAEEAALGLLAGTLLGLAIATLFVHSRPVEAALLPWVVASQTVPVLALAPILISLVGINLQAKVLIATYLVFFAVTVSAVKGLKSADALAHELMRSYAANLWQIYWKLRLPAALPFIFTGLKIASTAALVGAIVSELLGSEYGLGALLVAGNNFNKYLLLWSTMLAASLLGLAAYLLIAGLERLATRGRQVSR